MSGRGDSNPRPLGPEPSALPGCATPRGYSAELHAKIREFWKISKAAYRTSPPRWFSKSDSFSLAGAKSGLTSRHLLNPCRASASSFMAPSTVPVEMKFTHTRSIWRALTRHQMSTHSVSPADSAKPGKVEAFSPGIAKARLVDFKG